MNEHLHQKFLGKVAIDLTDYQKFKIGAAIEVKEGAPAPRTMLILESDVGEVRMESTDGMRDLDCYRIFKDAATADLFIAKHKAESGED